MSNIFKVIDRGNYATPNGYISTHTSDLYNSITPGQEQMNEIK